MTPGLQPHSCCEEAISWEELCPGNQYYSKVKAMYLKYPRQYIKIVFVRCDMLEDKNNCLFLCVALYLGESKLHVPVTTYLVSPVHQSNCEIVEFITFLKSTWTYAMSEVSQWATYNQCVIYWMSCYILCCQLCHRVN